MEGGEDGAGPCRTAGVALMGARRMGQSGVTVGRRQAGGRVIQTRAVRAAGVGRGAGVLLGSSELAPVPILPSSWRYLWKSTGSNTC